MQILNPYNFYADPYNEASLHKQSEKIKGEVGEVVEEIALGDKQAALIELWDVVQASLTMMYMIGTLPEIDNARKEHYEKIKRRAHKEIGVMEIKLLSKQVKKV